MITIEINDQGVLEALRRLQARVGNLKPVLRGIGEVLIKSTKRRFATGTAPDGTPWAPNSPVTYDRLATWHLTKKGKLSKAGAARLAGKKPLIGETRRLSSQINAVLQGDALLVGSPMEYAATQQFGAEQGEFGTTRRGGPIPWGDIPARPFLGLSEADKRHILEIVAEALGGA